MKYLIFLFVFFSLCLTSVGQSISFEEPISLIDYSPDLQGFTNPVLPMDYNSDGITDFYFADRFESDLFLFKGIGNDEFELIDIPQTAYDALKTIDFDKDGDLDIVNERRIFLYESADSFSYYNPMLRGTIIEVEDFNGDGLFDFFTQTNETNVFEDQELILFINNGDDTYSEEVLGVGLEYSDIEIGDIDGDGDIDAIGTLTQETNPVIIFRNEGGSFLEERTGHIFDSSSNIGFLVDMDNDSDLDFITNDAFSGLHIIENIDGFKTGDETIEIPSQQITAFNIADLNDDGFIDIVKFGSNSSSLKLEVMMGMDNLEFQDDLLLGSYDRPGGFSYPNPNYTANNLSIYDYDNDGKKDLLFSSGWTEPSQMLFFRNTSELSSTNNLLESNNLVIAPNPVVDHFMILENDIVFNKYFKYEIINSFGIRTTSAINTEGQVNVHHLSPGIYYIKLESEGIIGRFIKQD